MNLTDFLNLKDQFSLGHLTTEGFHPLSHNFSQDAKSNLKTALEAFQKIDALALEKVKANLDKIYPLAQDIHQVLAQGRKVFMAGCGATGRLSLALERIYQKKFPDQIIGFMAGGDYALIKSVESFEDEMSYGPRQLKEVGYSAGDLVLGVTEAGETSFVIGAALYGITSSGPSPWMFFCNDEKDLMIISRCRNYITNPQVKKLSLNVGPMAISGSTRLQASTVQMLSLGLCFEWGNLNQDEFKAKSVELIEQLLTLSYLPLAPLIETEADLYQADQYLTYQCDADYALSVLTDTTERSPTFNLSPFENSDDMPMSRCYLAVKDSHSAEQAWSKMLGRIPRGLDWPQLNNRINLASIYTFDISERAISRRGAEKFEIELKKSQLSFQLGQIKVNYTLPSSLFLFEHLTLKLLLNCHSTLLMGRLDRYRGNVMTWVKPSNFKLIDRATRYAMQILKQQGKVVDYALVASKVIEHSGLREESIVLRVVSELK